MTTSTLPPGIAAANDPTSPSFGAFAPTHAQQAIISLAHNLKLKVVGEGVETGAQFEFLKKHGCDEVQGYHFGRPMPAAEFERFAAGTVHD